MGGRFGALPGSRRRVLPLAGEGAPGRAVVRCHVGVVTAVIVSLLLLVNSVLPNPFVSAAAALFVGVLVPAAAAAATAAAVVRSR